MRVDETKYSIIGLMGFVAMVVISLLIIIFSWTYHLYQEVSEMIFATIMLCASSGLSIYGIILQFKHIVKIVKDSEDAKNYNFNLFVEKQHTICRMIIEKKDLRLRIVELESEIKKLKTKKRKENK